MSKKMTIAKRLGWGFGSLLALMVLITAIGIQRVAFMDETLTAVNRGATLKQRYAINFRGSVHDRAIAVRDAVLEHDLTAAKAHVADIERLAAFYADSAQKLDQLMATDATEEDRRLLARIKEIERRAVPGTQRVIDLRLSGDVEAARTMLLREVSPAYTEWLAAINAFDEPIVLLLGGRDKHLPWDELSAAVHKRVDHVVLFGEAANLISNFLGKPNPGDRLQSIDHAEKLQGALEIARSIVKPGDVVLFSPGGTSFDEFGDFEERGEFFRKWVNQQ